VQGDEDDLRVTSATEGRDVMRSAKTTLLYGSPRAPFAAADVGIRVVERHPIAGPQDASYNDDRKKGISPIISAGMW